MKTKLFHAQTANYESRVTVARKYFFALVLVIVFCAFTSTLLEAKVLTGIDNIGKYSELFKDKKVGLITNQTGVNSELESSIDIFKKETDLRVLFSPEHGIRGDINAGADVNSYVDEKTHLTVYSLYKHEEGVEITEEMLKNVDVLAYDIQDVGARFYTYISTMVEAMKVCKKYNKTFVVLDRPNPLSGMVTEGGIVESNFVSFVGECPVTVRYGLTPGELASFLDDKMDIKCKLAVIPMSHWKRDMYWDDTELTWIPTSPNMPTPETALVYSGMCFLEGTNISEGRGTTFPFLQLGAPWIKDPEKLADTLNELDLKGVKFKATSFTPTSNKYEDETCNGVRLYVTDKTQFRPVTTAVYVIYTIKGLYKEDFEYKKVNGKWWIDLLTGSSLFRESSNPQEVLKIWNRQSEEFATVSQNYRLYN